MKDPTLLCTCSQCDREQPAGNMYNCLMNEGKRICRHCYTYQLDVRKRLCIGKP